MLHLSRIRLLLPRMRLQLGKSVCIWRNPVATRQSKSQSHTKIKTRIRLQLDRIRLQASRIRWQLGRIRLQFNRLMWKLDKIRPQLNSTRLQLQCGWNWWQGKLAGNFRAPLLRFGYNQFVCNSESRNIVLSYQVSLLLRCFCHLWNSEMLFKNRIGVHVCEQMYHKNCVAL